MFNLTKQKRTVLFILRISIGWLMLYAGITKVFDSGWTSAGYLTNAKTFASFYQFLASPELLPIIDFVNEWGLTFLGISLILGALVRLSAPLGALLMLLYYFPALEFPYVGTHSFIIDEHIIYAIVLNFLAVTRAGRIWGLDGILSKVNSLFS